MNVTTNEIKLIIAFLLFMCASCFANENNGRPYASYKLLFSDRNHESVLDIYKNDFVANNTWNYEKYDYPVFSMSSAISVSLKWASTTFSEYSWSVSEFDVIFFDHDKFSCVYIIILKGIGSSSNIRPSMAIGVNLDGRIIKPVIKPIDHQ